MHLHVSADEGHHELRGQPRSFDASPTAIARDGFIVTAWRAPYEHGLPGRGGRLIADPLVGSGRVIRTLSGLGDDDADVA